MELRITKKVEEANLITHDAKFHPDDVFATAFMSKVIENPVVYRTSVRNVPDKSEAIIYDVGLGKFDHHGEDAKRDEKGMKYCGFGLLWEEYGRSYLKKIKVTNVEIVFNKIKEKLVEQINGIDNGVFPIVEAPYKLMDLDEVIDLYNNNWDEDTDNNDNFMRAVGLASEIFDLLIKKEIACLKALERVEEAILKAEDNILILDEYMPYSEALFESCNPKARDIKVIIMPSNRGGYNVKPITVSKESKELLINFPLEYRGKKEDELRNLSQIETLQFVHASGFLANTGTLDDAILLAKQAIKHG